MSDSNPPLVAVLMGSKSDWDVMRSTHETLDQFGIAHECRVLSAHRTPHETAEYVSGAEARGVRVLIAAAGAAADDGVDHGEVGDGDGRFCEQPAVPLAQGNGGAKRHE